MSNVFLLPIAVFIIFQFTFIGTYIAAVVQGHVVPTVPYISDAATYSPESCVFGQFVNIGSVLLGVVIYIRYRQVCELNDRYENIRPLTEKLNWRAVWIGLGSCLGISIVGNFQETNVRLVHYVGASLCFGFGTIYFWIQAVLSYYMQPFIGTMLKAHIRLGISALCTILFIVSAVTGIISHILYDAQDPRHWYPSDGGWEYHVASSISEWVISTVFSFYILSFTDEFRDIHLDHPPIQIIEYQEIDYTISVVDDAATPFVRSDDEIVS